MAEVHQRESYTRKGGMRLKKLSTRIDLTPMVDLGFLLITFFIFTTTLSEPTAMKLVVPDNHPVKDPPVTAESKTLSLLLGADNTIYYYNGQFTAQWKRTGYNAAGIRAVIQQKLNQVKAQFGSASGAVILIKPTSDASYRNVLAVLDEMLINDVKRYMLLDPSTEEKEALVKK